MSNYVMPSALFESSSKPSGILLFSASLYSCIRSSSCSKTKITFPCCSIIFKATNLITLS